VRERVHRGKGPRVGIVSSFAGVELSPGLEEMLHPAGFRNFLSYSAIMAGNQWIATRLPMRFIPDYAIHVLGASPGKDGIPFFSKGRLISKMKEARSVAKAKGRSVELRIVMPAGWLNAHPHQARAFRKLPPVERLELNEWFSDAMQNAIAESFTGKKTTIGSKRMQKALATASGGLGGKFAADRRFIARGGRGSLNKGMMAQLRQARAGGAVAGAQIAGRLNAMRAGLIADKYERSGRAIIDRALAGIRRHGGTLADAARRLPVFREGVDGRRLANERWRKEKAGTPDWALKFLGK
jgi:hypothetical protein